MLSRKLHAQQLANTFRRLRWRRKGGRISRRGNGTCSAWTPWLLAWCRGPESNWLRPPFQGGALPVSYPGTLESVNFRGAHKRCQISRRSADFGAVVTAGNRTKAGKPSGKRAATAKTKSAAAQNIGGEQAASKVTLLTIGHSTRTIGEFLAMLAAHGVQHGEEFPYRS